MSRIRTLVAALAMSAIAAPAPAQDAAGDWWGVLQASPTIALRVAFHFKPVEGQPGAFTGTFDSLDQNPSGIPLGEASVSGGVLVATLPAIAGRFEGKWDEAAKAWRGSWTQGGAGLPLVLSAGTAPAPAAPAPLPADWAVPADAAVARLIDARIAPRPGEGIVVGVIEPGGTRIVARGPAGARPFDGRTEFEIGSMTKVFTALILADMVNKRAVSLDDPAEKYLPAGARLPERGGRRITLRDLATHTSGLPRLPDNMPFANPEDPYADYTEALLLEFLGCYQLPRDIGARFEYSNLGFGLLGYLLSRVAHTDYASLVAQRITRPLGMRDTVIALSPDQKARFAQGHDPYMRPTAPWTLPTFAGAGALRSTAEDMLKFLAAAIDPRSPMAAAMKLATAERRPIGQPNSQIGLAWIVAAPAPGRETLFHDGGTGGFRTAMAIEPAARRAVVVLTNAAIEPGADDLAMHLLIGSPVRSTGAVPPAPPAPKAHTEIRLSTAELDRVVGRYQIAGGPILDIRREGDGLRAGLAGQAAFPIYPEGPLDYFWRAVDAQLHFTADASGAVTGATFTQQGQSAPVKRLP